MTKIHLLITLKLKILMFSCSRKTSRERHKSAPYPRHKNSKRTSKRQVSSFTVSKIEKPNKMDRVARRPGPASASPWRAKRMTLSKLSTFLSHLKGGPVGEKTSFRKRVSMPKKTERGDPLGCFNIYSVAKHQKN